MELRDRAEQARQRLKATLDADPVLKKAFREALEQTRQHFQKPEVIQGMASTIVKMKDAFESGKVKEIAEKFKEKHGLSGDTKLTDEMKHKLAEELADGILGK
jgi:molecular chaperone GrpE (heat shock protein)